RLQSWRRSRADPVGTRGSADAIPVAALERLSTLARARQCLLDCGSGIGVGLGAGVSLMGYVRPGAFEALLHDLRELIRIAGKCNTRPSAGIFMRARFRKGFLDPHEGA